MEVILVKILELILRIVLKLIEVLSSKPSDETPPINLPKQQHKEEKKDGVQSTQNSTGWSTYDPNQTNNVPQKSVGMYNEEVNDLLAQVMEAQRATHEADLNEIIRLRREVSRLQEELILAKANVQGKQLPDRSTTTQTFQGTDDVKDSADQQKK